MAVLELDLDPSPRTLRWFGVLLAVFCGLVSALLEWRFDLVEAARIVRLAGVAVAVVYYLVPPIRKPLVVGWTMLFFPVGWVLSHVLLAAIYYLVLTPIALVMRLFGKDGMARKLDATAESYRISSTKAPAKNLERPF